MGITVLVILLFFQAIITLQRAPEGGEEKQIDRSTRNRSVRIESLLSDARVSNKISTLRMEIKRLNEQQVVHNADHFCELPSLSLTSLQVTLHY